MDMLGMEGFDLSAGSFGLGIMFIPDIMRQRACSLIYVVNDPCYCDQRQSEQQLEESGSLV